MRAFLAIFCSLAIVSVAGSEDILPALEKAEQIELYYVGASHADFHIKEIRDGSLIRDLARLIEYSDGEWKRLPMPAPNGEVHLSFKQSGNTICNIDVGEDFFVRENDASMPAGMYYIKHVRREDAGSIRRIAFKLWLGPNAPDQ